MRANLLPRPRERIRLFGLTLDRDHLREAAIGVAIVVAVLLLGNGIESYRLARVQAATAAADAQLAASAPARADAKRLAQDVARYQQIAREATYYRDSGADAAIALARLGNSLPSDVYLDEIARENHAYQITGDARAIGQVGATIVALGRVGTSGARLTTVEERHGDGVHFQARVRLGRDLESPAGTVGAVAPPNLLPAVARP